MRKLVLGVLLAVSAIPGGSASAEPCVVWDPPPPRVEPECPPSDVFEVIADGTTGLDLLTCAALTTAGTPTLVNALAPTFTMDADDCDLYVEGERFIDFVPYED